jgi:CRP/FNR family cyclic AMP-dependent transcriptional regulator
MSGVPPSVLAGHAFLQGMTAEQVAKLAQATTAISMAAGHRFFEEGGLAERFWLIRTGHVALDVHVPGRARLIVETIGDGDLIGLSWASLPRQWQYGAEAIQPTTAFELDAAAVIALCDADPALGYQLTRRLMAVAARRLHAARIRMMDLYAPPGQPGAAS